MKNIIFLKQLSWVSSLLLPLAVWANDGKPTGLLNLHFREDNRQKELSNLFTSFSISNGIKYFIYNDQSPDFSHYSIQSQPFGWQSTAPNFLNPALTGWQLNEPGDNGIAVSPLITSSAISMAAQYYFQNQSTEDSTFLVPFIGNDNFGFHLMTKF